MHYAGSEWQPWEFRELPETENMDIEVRSQWKLGRIAADRRRMFADCRSLLEAGL